MFSQGSTRSWVGGCPPPRYLLEFLWMFQHSIQAMQHLRWSSLWQNSWWQETIIVDCCYVELCIICDRTPRSDTEMHQVQSQQKQLEQYVKYIQHCIFRVNNKDTRMMSGASIVNFEHVLSFILLILLNLNK